ncbi:MAG: SDR family oxidoreductase [Acidobacteriota bacterium]|nr:MAG: SDR family oxidoreductase [Acidobacteriota bacterium]
MRFQDKVIWITGASSGIGEALAVAFSREDAKLILSARREDELERVKALCPGPHEKICVLPMDVGQLDLIEEKTAIAESFFGPIDILVNNAGISQRSLVRETKLEVELNIMNVNFNGTIALTKAVLPSMLERKSGHLVIISSLMGYLDIPLRATYAASKHALQGYFDSLRTEIRRDGVKVIMICPGFIRTNISVNAMTADGSTHDKMDKQQARGMSAEACAVRILSAIERGKEEVLIGGVEVLAVYAKRFFPKLYAIMVRRLTT